MNEKNPSFKKNMLWNAAGNIVYLAAQWLVTVLAVLLGGLGDAGVLALAMTVSAGFQTLALFGIRNFQVSDIEGKYSDSTYVGFRSVTCAAALVLCLAFALANSYSGEVCHAIALFMIFRLAENYSDVLHGIAQNNGRLDIAGKSFALKGAGLLLCFVGGYGLFGGLLEGIALMAAFSVLTTALYDFTAVRRVADFRIFAPLGQCKLLAARTLPLCAYQFLYALILSMPKWFIELECGNEILGAYSSVFAPVMLLQAVGSYLYAPFTSVFSRLLSEKRRAETFGLFYKLSAAILGFFLITLAAAVLFGEWAMVLVFGEQIRPYVGFLIPILFANLAVMYLGFLTMITVVLRQISLNLISFALGAGALAFTPLWIRGFGANGASYALIVSACIIISMLLFRILVLFSRMKPDSSEASE